MINTILIALLAWPVLGQLILLGYSIVRSIEMAVRWNMSAEEIVDRLTSVSKKREHKKSTLFDSKMVTLSYTDLGSPKDENERNRNIFVNAMGWPITLLIMRDKFNRAALEQNHK